MALLAGINELPDRRGILERRPERQIRSEYRPRRCQTDKYRPLPDIYQRRMAQFDEHRSPIRVGEKFAAPEHQRARVGFITGFVRYAQMRRPIKRACPERKIHARGMLHNSLHRAANVRKSSAPPCQGEGRTRARLRRSGPRLFHYWLGAGGGTVIMPTGGPGRSSGLPTLVGQLRKGV